MLRITGGITFTRIPVFLTAMKLCAPNAGRALHMIMGTVKYTITGSCDDNSSENLYVNTHT